LPPCPSAPLECSLELEPLDWFWATWRRREPLVRPAPSPFDKAEALRRLRSIVNAPHSWNWPWHKAGLSVSLTLEEAHFWLTAMTLATQRDDARGIPKTLETQNFTGEITLEETEAMLRASRWTTREIAIPLANLFSPAEIVARMQSVEQFVRNNASHAWGVAAELRGLAVGLGEYLLPYLTVEEARTLRDQLRPALKPANWPASHLEMPPLAFSLAARLGMHAELRALVESWPDDRYSAQAWLDHYQHPQEMVFGLGDPAQVQHHMRRLRLRLSLPTYIRAWLAHTEYGALDYVRDTILAMTNREEAEKLLAELGRAKAPETAVVMLDLVLNSRAPRAARAWLEANPGHAVAGLLPLAAGRGRLSEAAVDFLRSLRHRGAEPLLRAAVEAQPPEVAGALREILLEVPEERVPAFDDATTPDWLRQAVAGLSLLSLEWTNVPDLPPVLVGDRRLNAGQTAALLTALAKSSPTKPHPLVTAVKAHADRASLDTFAWKLFQRWLGDGAPSKEKWALVAVGLLGSDPAALKLAPLVRAWPGESQHQRAVLGLECLRAIGTDTALMQINGIAQKVAFKGLKARAMECMEAIAADRGLTRAELEDRIVPDCDLDERGSREFDYGPRRFRFVLGPQMKPMVREEGGRLRPNLPDPTSKDDPKLAGEAREEWKLLKKQVGEVAKIQAYRLEQAMVTGRRWPRGEFESLLVRHPLMTNLARLLVWGCFDVDGRLAASFRLTEDQTYADVNDDTFRLPEEARIGIVHPLQLGEEERAAWGELLSDYEIAPPFPQIGRPVFHLEPGEAEKTEIPRYQGVKVPALSLVGTLQRLDWLRGIPEDAGVFHEHAKPFHGANVTAILEYADGVPVGYIEGWADQVLEHCYFTPGIYIPVIYPGRRNMIPLGQVDPVVISEVLSDLNTIAAKGN
jgi:hypothetical protein